MLLVLLRVSAKEGRRGSQDLGLRGGLRDRALALDFFFESASEKELRANEIGGIGGCFEAWVDNPYFEGFLRRTLAGGDDFPVGVVLGDDR